MTALSPPGQRHPPEMGDPDGAVVPGDEDLATPDGPVTPVPGPVEGEPDHPLASRHLVLHHDRGDMGMMMLDQLDGLAVSLGPVSGVVTGVGIGHQRGRCHLVDLGELPAGPGQGSQRLHPSHVPEVLAHPGVPTDGQAERVLQLAAHGQEWWHVEREAYRERGEPPRTPDRQLAAVLGADDRVVTRHVDRAVVDQPRIGDPSQAASRVSILIADGLVGQVAARHHDDPEPVGPGGTPDAGHGSQEEVVERRVGKKDPELRVPRCHPGRHRGTPAASEEHDRALWPDEKGGLGGTDDGELAGSLEIGHHHGERFVRPVLPPTQRRHRLGARGVARQVVAAQSLDGDDLPPRQCVASSGEGGVPYDRRSRPRGMLDPGAFEPHVGTADRTGDRLGVEPPVGWIAVLDRATGA